MVVIKFLSVTFTGDLCGGFQSELIYLLIKYIMNFVGVSKVTWSIDLLVPAPSLSSYQYYGHIIGSSRQKILVNFRSDGLRFPVISAYMKGVEP